MKRILLSLCLAIPAFLGYSQITISDAVFPVPGDTFSVRNVVTGFAGIDVGAAGPNQSWDFSALANGTLVETIYLDPAGSQNGVGFPNATAFIDVGGGVESFFQKSASTFASLGTVGSDISGLGIGDVAAFNQPYILQRAPLTYTSGNFSTNTSATVRFSLNDLPDAIKDTILANVPLNLDSMGFGISLSRQDDVDAWGTLEIPGGSYEVLREKRVEIRAGVLEAKVPFLGWTDVTPFIMAIGGLGAIGNDTSVMYYYHSNISKEPIALVSMDASGQNITSIQYKDGARTVGTKDLLLGPDAFTLSPNPVNDNALFSIDGLEKGIYTLLIYDLQGQQQKLENFEVADSKTQLTVNVTNLITGNYVVIIRNTNGKVLGNLKMIKQ